MTEPTTNDNKRREIDFDEPLVDLWDEPIKQGDNELKLGTLCYNSLKEPLPDPASGGVEKIDDGEVWKRAKLLKKLCVKGEPGMFKSYAIKSKEKDLLMGCLHKYCRTMGSGQLLYSLCREVIRGDSLEEDDD